MAADDLVIATVISVEVDPLQWVFIVVAKAGDYVDRLSNENGRYRGHRLKKSITNIFI